MNKPKLDNKLFPIQRILSFSVILLVSSISIYLFTFNTSEREYALIPDIPESTIPLIEKSQLLMHQEKIKNKQLETSDENFLFNNSSAIASINDQEKIIEESLITLKFLNPTWFQIEINLTI